MARGNDAKAAERELSAATPNTNVGGAEALILERQAEIHEALDAASRKPVNDEATRAALADMDSIKPSRGGTVLDVKARGFGKDVTLVYVAEDEDGRVYKDVVEKTPAKVAKAASDAVAEHPDGSG